MNQIEILDIVAEVIRKTNHPEITDVSRFPGNPQGAPAGVKVAFGNGSNDYLLAFPDDGWKGRRS